IAPPTAPYWTAMTNRLTAMGLTAAQVQVAWLKEAEAGPPNNFPSHAQALRDTLKKVVRNLHDKFPNLRLVYCSSRIYGGYASQGGLNPEPQAYESGYAVKWLIEDQVNGDPALNYGHYPGPIRAPLLLWGPYLWADGPTPRSDGLVWLPADLEADNVHPSASGEQKVAALLAAFFASDPTAASWWPAVGGETLVTLDALHDSHVSAAAPGSNFGAATLLTEQGGAQPINIYVRFDASAETRPIKLAKLDFRVSAVGGGFVRRVNDTSWTEGAVTWSSAPPLGATLAAISQATKDGTADANVTADLNGDPDRQVSYALTIPAVSPGTLVSREGGQAPRLVLVVQTATAGVPPPAEARLTASPNPARGATRITYELERAGVVEIAVIDVGGRLVRRLVAGARPAGPGVIGWDGHAEDGSPVSAGLYFVRLESAAGRISRKIVLAH
ncbi:MAG TPA: FlgD immunoglobulin-like domain containing protein, partial [Candidatus Eisenbacteria bacterium]